jgi:SNF2 family DNA or RNA helicase
MASPNGGRAAITRPTADGRRLGHDHAVHRQGSQRRHPIPAARVPPPGREYAAQPRPLANGACAPERCRTRVLLTVRTGRANSDNLPYMTTAASPPVDELSPVLAPYLSLLGALRQGAPVDGERTRLVEAAVEMWSRPGFDTFLSQPRLDFEPFDYQWQTAQTVLRRMRGRAILADEVGLGKTIEAGLVLSELRMRSLADRALVVVPAGLTEQWREELERKFALPTAMAGKAEWDAGSDHPVVIVSLASARREPLRSVLTHRPWDAIIVDEAHRLRNPRSASGRLARALSARYLLLLTATPVENRLQDLYELVSLVAPGLLGTPAQFRAQHGSGESAAPRNVAGLRARSREVMVRHRRSEVSVMLPQRLAETVLVTPSPEEAALYAAIAARIRAEARDTPRSRRLTLRSLARLAGSSPAAVAPTLVKVGWEDLGRKAAAIAGTSKAAELAARLRGTVPEEKVLVFTAFRQTLNALASELSSQGIPAAVYHGSLARSDKEKAISAFRDEVPVLLSTESAGEGRNLQFCHMMVNIDLPWNPMQIEQRLGRLHRVGQTRDVVLTNLVARDTIEQRILHVLEAKINLFELVVGELDMILGRIDDDFDFEASVFDAYVESRDDAEFAERLAEIGENLARARTEYLRDRSFTDELIGQERA